LADGDDNVIYTRLGDTGETSLVSGERVSKTDDRVEAYGTVDELSSVLGVIISYDKDFTNVLENIQNKLQLISTELAGGDPMVSNEDVTELEMQIDEYSKDLPEIKSFVRLGGYKVAALLQLSRAICRRAERRVLIVKPRKEVIAYLNRLSDLLFTLARWENMKSGFGDRVI